MAEHRIKTVIWVKAHIRKAAVAGVPALVVRHGDDDAGAVLIKVNALSSCSCVVFAAGRDLDGRRVWRRATGGEPVSEADADGYIARQIGYDSDLWVVEIEDREGRHFLDDPIE